MSAVVESAAAVPALLQRLTRLQKRRATLRASAQQLQQDSVRLERVCDAHVGAMQMQAEEEAQADQALQRSVVSLT